MTRIVGGSAGGRRIAVPQHKSGLGTRPTTDRVRESLFNVLAARLDFDGIAVLDLYAGSGALGLEALSRGAASALFVESDARAAAVIAENAATLGLSGATVRRGTVAQVLGSAAPTPMDLIFADPPYALSTEELQHIVAGLTAHGWVADGAVAVLERASSAPELDWPDGWEPLRARRYGDTRLELAEYG